MTLQRYLQNICLLLIAYVSLKNVASLHSRAVSVIQVPTTPTGDSHRPIPTTHASTYHNLPAHPANAINQQSSFAACLLVMDDNHWLIEWLAYHYHVLHLRHLIVAVDPRSQTSPASILQRYSTIMNITIWWKDADYVASGSELVEAQEWVRGKFENDHPSSTLIRHRARQRLFYYHCLLEHQQHNRTWTLLTDTDEFVTVNYHSLRALRPALVGRVPPVSQAGSVATLLDLERRVYGNDPSNNLTQSPCLQIPRSRFGTVTNETTVSTPPSAPFDYTHFATLRWRHHADPHHYQQNRISKTIIDLSRVEKKFLRPVDSIHRPIKTYCKRRQLHVRSPQQILLIHHYLGSWEQYAFRQDARAGKERSVSMYYKTAALDEGVSDTMVGWVEGFVESVGTEMAKTLLAGVGEVEKAESAETRT